MFNKFKSVSTNNKSLLLVVAIFLMSISTIPHASVEHEVISKAYNVEILDSSQTDDGKLSRLSVEIAGQKLQFILSTNNGIYTSNVPVNFKKETFFYKGKIDTVTNSWIRLNYFNGKYSGAFFDGNALFLLAAYSDISSRLSPEIKHQFIASDSDLFAVNVKDIKHNGICGNNSHNHNSLSIDYSKYVSDLNDLVKSYATREIQITLVADTEYVTSSSDATVEMLGELNIADGIFQEQLDITIVADSVIPLTSNENLTSTNPESLLYAFTGSGIPNPGLRHLFTGKDLDGSTVGIAFVGQLCNSYSSGLSQRLGLLTSLVFTHELGHNFGSPHDGQPGTACASVGAGFIMFPSVNGNHTSFSSCSVDQMVPLIEQASTGPFACVNEISGESPIIVSTPNTEADVGEAYTYDADNRVDIEGTEPVEFTLEQSPETMQIDSTGLITWTPTVNELGDNTVVVRVDNAFGSDFQTFTIYVTSEYINFEEVVISPFGGNQDGIGEASIGENANQLVLSGNAWKSIPIDYNFTVNTILEFEFSSTEKGEIHAIGVESDNTASTRTIFNLFGSQRWLNMSYRYSNFGTSQSFSIPIGAIASGDYDRLVFAMDNDSNFGNPNAIFTNVRLYERETEILPSEALNLDNYNISSYEAQDGSGSLEIVENGYGAELYGNSWKVVDLTDIEINASTVLSFDFKSTKQGEIHGIGFVRKNESLQPRVFQVYGTQRWGNNTFKYSGSGVYEEITIPIGEFHTDSPVKMILIMDQDAENDEVNSSFRNIIFNNVE
ncbi:M12 family metallo-peptidase [Glaciecola sp. 1036]|uniref:M12 family metallo-peptidase n=1 Tax=Alteromonadaceae TaxID=72275 RepID=UPI003CFC18BA